MEQLKAIFFSCHPELDSGSAQPKLIAIFSPLRRLTFLLWKRKVSKRKPPLSNFLEFLSSLNFSVLQIFMPRKLAFFKGSNRTRRPVPIRSLKNSTQIFKGGFLVFCFLTLLFFTNSCYALTHAQQGAVEYREGDYSSAIKYFQKALDENPANSSARNRLAASYMARGANKFNKKEDLISASNDFRLALFYIRYDRYTSNIIQKNIEIATQNLDNILEFREESIAPDNRLKMAKILRGGGKFKEAFIEYDKASTEFPAESFEAMGDISRVLLNTEQAINYYEKALANTDKANIQLKLARLLDKVGRDDDAVKAYSAVLASTQDGEVIDALEKIWRKKLQQNPSDANIHLNLGAILQKKKDYLNAMAQYKAALALNPVNVTARLNIATLMQEEKKYTEAVELYNEILNIDPQNILAHYYKGKALKMSGNKKLALKEFQDVLFLDKNHKAAKAELIDTIKKLDNRAEALFMLEQMAENNPNDFNSQYIYAYELHRDRDYEKAIQYYNKAIAIDKTNADAGINIARIYIALENIPQAEKILNELNTNQAKEILAEIRANKWAKQYKIASTKYEDGSYWAAIEEYSKISEKTAEVYLGIGACFQKLKRYDKAIENYDKALELGDNNYLAYYYKGIAYSAKADFDKAKTNYKKALKLNPDNKKISQALASIAEAEANDLVRLALLDYNAKKYNESIEKFNKAISLHNSGNAYYYRAMSYEGVLKRGKAISDYKKAVQISPDLTISYYAIALNFDMMENYKQAKAYYQKFIKNHKKQDEYSAYAKSRIEEI